MQRAYFGAELAQPMLAVILALFLFVVVLAAIAGAFIARGEHK
jgi:hypothetical protein